jgi:hypothetical protein
MNMMSPLSDKSPTIEIGRESDGRRFIVRQKEMRDYFSVIDISRATKWKIDFSLLWFWQRFNNITLFDKI